MGNGLASDIEAALRARLYEALIDAAKLVIVPRNVEHRDTHHNFCVGRAILRP